MHGSLKMKQASTHVPTNIRSLQYPRSFGYKIVIPNAILGIWGLHIILIAYIRDLRGRACSYFITIIVIRLRKHSCSERFSCCRRWPLTPKIDTATWTFLRLSDMRHEL